MTPQQRDKIIDALIAFRNNNWDGNDAEFAKAFDINPAVFNRIKKGERERIVADDKLITLGRKLQVNWKDAAPWNVVNTYVFEKITTQLRYCKENGIARIFCDKADTGKTTAAKQFMLQERNVYYIDCSRVKARTQLIRALARTIGVNSKGPVRDVIDDTIYMLQATDKPLVILDEAGDLHYEAWLEIKAYWNALEGYCGWYMMGADGLRRKIDNNLRSERVGYAEIFRRFGSQYMTVVSKMNPVDQKLFYASEAEKVAHANLQQGTDYLTFIKKTKVDSLTRLKEDIQKSRQINAI